MQIRNQIQTANQIGSDQKADQVKLLSIDNLVAWA